MSAAPRKQSINYNDSNKGLKYYPPNSEEVLKVKKAFKLPEKTENVITQYIDKIKLYYINIDVEKQEEKNKAIDAKAEVLQHIMNMDTLNID